MTNARAPQASASRPAEDGLDTPSAAPASHSDDETQDR